MTEQVARGEFTLHWAPEPPFDDAAGAALARVTVTKEWTGDITGSSVAHLITAMSAVPASAGYVAIERMTVAVAGRTGTFVLQHSALSRAGGNQDITITVVPDSGTEELKTISGRLVVTVEGRDRPTDRGGRHFYELFYEHLAH